MLKLCHASLFLAGVHILLCMDTTSRKKRAAGMTESRLLRRNDVV
jgi:hypothetical protein